MSKVLCTSSLFIENNEILMFFFKILKSELPLSRQQYIWTCFILVQIKHIFSGNSCMFHKHWVFTSLTLLCLKATLPLTQCSTPTSPRFLWQQASGTSFVGLRSLKRLSSKSSGPLTPQQSNCTDNTLITAAVVTLKPSQERQASCENQHLTVVMMAFHVDVKTSVLLWPW